MALDHDRIEELLAGHALHALSEPDAAEADRLLVEHLPTCPRCRDTLDGLQAVAGDLALDAAPAAPPDTLLARIRRETRPRPAWRRLTPTIVAAASVAALLAMGGVTMTLGQRASRAESQRGALTEAIRQMSVAGLEPVALREEAAAGGSLVRIPGVQRIYLVGTEVPPPAADRVYRLWVGRGGEYAPVADFVPDGGLVVLDLTVDHHRFDEILITEEAAGPPGDAPAGVLRWSSALP